MLYELRSNGEYVKLFEPAYAFRASYARDRVRRRLLMAGVRQQLPFQSERMVGRRLQAGSRLVLTLGINKRADQQINYGAGDDVSEESIEDAGAPVRIRWHEGSFIEIPSQQLTRCAERRVAHSDVSAARAIGGAMAGSGGLVPVGRARTRPRSRGSRACWERSRPSGSTPRRCLPTRGADANSRGLKKASALFMTEPFCSGYAAQMCRNVPRLGRAMVAGYRPRTRVATVR